LYFDGTITGLDNNGQDVDAISVPANSVGMVGALRTLIITAPAGPGNVQLYLPIITKSTP
jgi:hypothetical protein